jgi:GDP-L-fucose synthase
MFLLLLLKLVVFWETKIIKQKLIYENLMIQSKYYSFCIQVECKKLLFLGSSCIYPKFCEVPIAESSLLTGHLEPTNDAYAIAKIAGMKMCQSYRTTIWI